MLKSELIAVLQEDLKRHGDGDVFIDSENWTRFGVIEDTCDYYYSQFSNRMREGKKPFVLLINDIND